MSAHDTLGVALAALSDAERAHYDRLLSTTSLLADIGFADILVLLPVIAPGGEHPADTPGARLENLTDTGHPDGRLESPADPGYPDSRLESPADPGQPADGGDGTGGGTGGRFVVTAHSRPMTSQTVHPEDLVGRVIDPSERPLAELALRTGASSNGGAYLAPQRRWVQSLAVPVNHSGRTVAVLLREFPSTSDRVWGRLENTYFAIFRRLAGMIADGAYPYPDGPGNHDHPPRVGDGVMVLDAWQRVTYLTPNAQSALRRLGINGDPTGRRLAHVGLEPRALQLTTSSALPHTEEIERNGHNVVLRCLPLLQEDTLTGVLMLVRDITDLRRADRLLITKNAALAEVHHRVKNNLQTVSSLLSLQSRWLEAPEAKEALAESARRIRLIATVHETLSTPGGDTTPFESVAASLSSLLRESLAPPGAPISIRVEGTVGPLPSEVMTTLAIVLNELVQNAMDHGFGGGTRGGTGDGDAGSGTGTGTGSGGSGNEIVIRIARRDATLAVSVSDNGGGMPDGPIIEGLGLTLVRTLVENDLGGNLRHRSSPVGTTVELTAPLNG